MKIKEFAFANDCFQNESNAVFGVFLQRLIISWRRAWVGGIAFLLLAIGYIIMAWGKFPVSVYFMISCPLFIISALFWLNWIKRKRR